MTASNFFRDVGAGIFKPVGDFVGGAVTALQPGRVQQMKALLENQKARTLLLKAQAVASGGKTDPYEKAGKLALAEQRLRESGADEAADIVLGKINETTGAQSKIDEQQKTDTTEAALAEYFQAGLGELEAKSTGRASQEQVGKFTQGFAKEAKKQGVDASAAEMLFGKLYKEEVGKAGVLRDDVLPRRDVIDVRNYFSYESEGAKPTPTPTPTPKGKETPAMAFEDLTQAATPDFPEDTTPKTFEQIGVATTEDVATLQEMDKALPDRDLKQEYQDDPEGMQRLMKLWREKKLTKKNLHKAFSALQLKAQQSLGVA